MFKNSYLLKFLNASSNCSEWYASLYALYAKLASSCGVGFTSSITSLAVVVTTGSDAIICSFLASTFGTSSSSDCSSTTLTGSVLITFIGPLDVTKLFIVDSLVSNVFITSKGLSICSCSSNVNAKS